METFIRDMQAFNKKFSMEYTPEAEEDLQQWFTFRRAFLYEEIIELQTAYAVGDLVEICDALVDLAYVSIGTRITYGAAFDGFLGPLHSMIIKPRMPDDLRLSRFCSAFETLVGESPNDDLPHELVHLESLIYHICDAHGLPFREMWSEVHKTNMQKVRGESARSSQFDVIKPKGWTPPDIKGILLYYGAQL